VEATGLELLRDTALPCPVNEGEVVAAIWSREHERAAQSQRQGVWILLAPDPGHAPSHRAHFGGLVLGSGQHESKLGRCTSPFVREPARSRNLFGHHPEDVACDDLFDAVPTGQMKPRGA
jgi:hypothetical protein